MNRTLEQLREFRSGPNSDVVHDLRVALRRSRSIADAMQEVDPHPDWNEMRIAARKLFQSLGELRDVQIMADWLNRLCPEQDALKDYLLQTLAAAEKLANLTTRAGSNCSIPSAQGFAAFRPMEKPRTVSRWSGWKRPKNCTAAPCVPRAKNPGTGFVSG